MTEEIHRPVVLCVDDDPVILELLFEILSSCGFSVLCESDPRRAATTVLVTRVDAAILDYDMPGYNGLELARIIRNHRPQVPVLMFSGTILPDDDLKSVQHFICKNQGVAALIDALRCSCGNRVATSSQR
jgi:CheY-like chemotaxis protein